MSVPVPLSAFDKEVRFVHPLVRAARRDAELAEIESHVREHGVIRGPTLFAALSPQATRNVVIVPDRAEKPRIATLADCARWLMAEGRPVFSRIGNGLFEFNGRLYGMAALIESIVALQRRETPSHGPGTEAVFDLLAGCAARGRRCPSFRSIHRFLRLRRGIRVSRDGGVEAIFETLARTGAIARRRTAGNLLIVTILTGPHAGMQTVGLDGATTAREAA
jgi:hypothetical protein